MKVLRMDEYIKDKVSEARHAKLLRASRENDDLKRLVEGTYVCVNPKLHLVEEDDGLDYPSILSSGDGATQSEVYKWITRLMVDCASCIKCSSLASRYLRQCPLSRISKGSNSHYFAYQSLNRDSQTKLRRHWVLG